MYTSSITTFEKHFEQISFILKFNQKVIIKTLYHIMQTKYI